MALLPVSISPCLLGFADIRASAGDFIGHAGGWAARRNDNRPNYREEPSRSQGIRQRDGRFRPGRNPRFVR